MKQWVMPSAVALVVGLLLVAVAMPVGADEDDEAPSAAKIKDILKNVKVDLATAVSTAEKAAEGKAVAAKLEAEGDELEYEVIVVKIAGDTVKFLEVDVDARTGKVDEVEDPDDDDDGADEDDDDDDGGEDDDS